MIVVIDLNLGNVGSVLNILKKIDAKARLSSRPEEIARAEKLILPGVGSFDQAISNLSDLKLLPVINQKVLQEKTSILGICLGAQLMTRNSEEGKLPGLGWIEGRTMRFAFKDNSQKLKIPHMGWNQVKFQKESMLMPDLANGAEQRYYFAHAYHLCCDNREDILATTHYGYDFTAAFARGNIYGVQFHPEKSHRFGMKLLKNFACGEAV